MAGTTAAHSWIYLGRDMSSGHDLWACNQCPAERRRNWRDDNPDRRPPFVYRAHTTPGGYSETEPPCWGPDPAHAEVK